MMGACGTADATDGFAAVDALVALVILSATIAFAIQSTTTARRAAVAARETAGADVLIRHLLDGPMSSGAGRSDLFAWRVDTVPDLTDGTAQGPKLCRRSAELSAIRTGRRYRGSTLTPCAGEGVR